MLAVRGTDAGCEAKAISIPPWEYAATVKTQIDGGPHKRRNMWFNSMIREEPYPGSNVRGVAQAETLVPTGHSPRCCMVSSARGREVSGLSAIRDATPACSC